MQQQAEGVGQKAVTAQAVGAETVLEFFNAVLTFTAVVVKSEDLGSSARDIGDPIWSICFVYCNCRKRGARYKSKLCAPGSSKLALAFVKLRAASGFISPRAGPGKPWSANSRSPSIPVSRLLRRQSVCLARQGRSLLQKLSSSIVMRHFVLTAVFQRLAR